MAEPPTTTTVTTTTTTTELDPIRKPPPPPPQPLWGTLEDLLLTCAVNRHGTNSWTSVSNQLNNHRRTSLFTPHLCRLKFLDLQRRFSSTADAAVWLDELRRLRVAELKRDLHRYDLSIVSLQLKVKRLKEEREKSVEKDVDERENSDVKKTGENETPAPENGLTIGESQSPDRKTEPEVEPLKTEPVNIEPDRDVGPGRGVDSCNGSSNSKEGERVDSGELGESASDVQSTASLRRREKEMREVCGNSSGGEENQSLGSKFSGGSDGAYKEGEGGSGGGGVDEGKSQRLVEFLNVVRTRECGSVFEGRCEDQESTKYKSLIKEHIDLGIIQKRIEEGRYSNCHTMFYRDLMLLVNNAVVFYSKTTSEHKSAVELRELVTQHFETHLSTKKGQTLTMGLPKPTKPEVDQADQTDLKPKLAITGPVIACRKRSSIAGKLSSPAAVKPASSEVLKKDDDRLLSTSFNAVTKKQTRDQSVTPRNSANKNQSNHPSPTQKSSQRIKGESSEIKADIKKSSSRVSKQGSRPGNDLLLDVLDSAVKRKIFGNGSSSGNLRSDRHKDQGLGSHSGLNKKTAMEKEERDSLKNKNGRASKKAATAVAVSGKRGRDGGRDSDTKKRQRR